MTIPFTAGAVIYAKDPVKLGDFYAQVTGLDIVHAGQDHVVLESPGCQLAVVAIPAPLAGSIHISEPPRIRTNTAIKPVFLVASLAAARRKAHLLGGELRPPEQEWAFRGSLVCDGHDPEGNVVQFREPL